MSGGEGGEAAADAPARNDEGARAGCNRGRPGVCPPVSASEWTHEDQAAEPKREALEVFGTAMAGRTAEEVAAELERLLEEDRALPEAERGGDWSEPPRVEVVEADVVRVRAETAHADVLALMLLAAGGRRLCVCVYPDAERRARWSPFERSGGGTKGFPEGVRARLVDAWGVKPRLLAPSLAALLIAVSLERMGVLVWQAAAVLFVTLFVLVLWLAGRQMRYRVEWYRIERQAS